MAFEFAILNYLQALRLAVCAYISWLLVAYWWRDDG